jgi:hypothetical protein
MSSQITGWPIRPLSATLAIAFVGIQFRFRETYFWTGILTDLTALSLDFAYRFFTIPLAVAIPPGQMWRFAIRGCSRPLVNWFSAFSNEPSLKGR